jgi:hypothetical protein
VLDAFAQVVGFQHVEALIAHAEVIEDLHHLSRKAAHRELRRAFHEQHHVVGFDLVGDELIDGHEIPHLSAQPSVGIFPARGLDADGGRTRDRCALHVSLYVA